MTKSPVIATTALMLVAAFALTACVSGAGDDASPTTPPSSPLTPTPTATLSLAPTLAFGGECENMLGVADVQRLLGDDAYLYSSEGGLGDATGTAGGMYCQWSTFDGYRAGVDLSVTAFPVDVVPDSVKDEYAEPSCPDVTVDGACYASATANDTWFVLRHTGSQDPGDPSPSPLPELDEALSLVTRALAGYPAPVAAPATPERWTVPTCAALGEAVDFASIWWATEVVNGLATEVDFGALGDVTAANELRGWCSWSDLATAEWASIEVMPGSWWEHADAGAILGGEPVAVPGADQAFLVTDEAVVLTAIVGANVIEFRGSSAEAALIAVERALGAIT